MPSPHRVYCSVMIQKIANEKHKIKVALTRIGLISEEEEERNSIKASFESSR